MSSEDFSENAYRGLVLSFGVVIEGFGILTSTQKVYSHSGWSGRRNSPLSQKLGCLSC